MQGQNKNQTRKYSTTQMTKAQERRACERRNEKSKGYIYISTVGWMDRRENKRRCNDSFTC